MLIEVVHGATGHRGHFLPKSEVHYTPTQEEIYYSLFGLDQAPAEPLANADSERSLRAAYQAEFLYFVVRREGNLPGALEAVRRFVDRLSDCFELASASLLLYYSGGWGFHVGLPQCLFGGFAPDATLPGQLAALSRCVLARCFNLDEETISYLEAGVQNQVPGRHFADVVPNFYQPDQLLRAPNSRNAHGGHYKIPLHAHELVALSVGQLLALAREPRPEFVPPRCLATQPVNAALGTCWRQVRGLETAGSEAAPPDLLEPLEAPFFGPAAPGQSFTALTAQAQFLFEHSSLSLLHVEQLLTLLNRANRHPLAAEQLRELVGMAARTASGRPPVEPGSVMPHQGLPWSDRAPPSWRWRRAPRRTPLALLLT